MNTQVSKEAPHAAGVKIPSADSPHHDEGLLDQALAETFPASDPISPAYEARLQREEDDARLGAGMLAFNRRVRRAAPSLFAFGAAALILLMTRRPRRRLQ